jgi:hypothetical protein
MWFRKSLVVWMLALFFPLLTLAVERQTVGAHTFHIDGTDPVEVKYTELDPTRYYALSCRINSPSQPLEVMIYSKVLIQDTIELLPHGLYGEKEYPDLTPDQDGQISYVLHSRQAYGRCELTRV